MFYICSAVCTNKNSISTLKSNWWAKMGERRQKSNLWAWTDKSNIIYNQTARGCFGMKLKQRGARVTGNHLSLEK